MSQVHSSETKLEENFKRELRRLTSKKFETNVRSLKGCPDFVFRRKKICIFIDSDFWHGWNYPRWKSELKTPFWHNKIENTRKRDREVTSALRKQGWVVVRIWEHQLKKNPAKVTKKLEKLII